MPKIKSLALILGVLIMSFLIGYLVLAWTEPIAAPPGENVKAPVNVSSTQQWKEGPVGVGYSYAGRPYDLSAGAIGASSFYDAETTAGPTYWYLNPSADISAVLRGNVGIGTTGPGSKLDVIGAIRTRDADGSSRYGVIQRSSGAGGNLHIDSYYVGGDSGGNTYINWFSGQGLYVGRGDSTNTALYVRSSDGNVGIGTTSPGPGYKLEVNGNANVSGIMNAQGYNNTSPSITSISRTFGSWNPNTSGKTIVVYVEINVAAPGDYGMVAIQLSPDGGTTSYMIAQFGIGSTLGSDIKSQTFVVPNGWSYRLVRNLGNPTILLVWEQSL